jgi:hypothetical protein
LPCALLHYAARLNSGVSTHSMATTLLAAIFIWGVIGHVFPGLPLAGGGKMLTIDDSWIVLRTLSRFFLFGASALWSFVASAVLIGMLQIDLAFIKGNSDYQALFVLARACIFALPFYYLLVKFHRSIARER